MAVTRAEADAFIARILPAALTGQQQAGVPASLTIAQAALESAWGGSGLTLKANNLFGMKGTGPAGSVTMATTEYVNGRAVQTTAAFRAYHDWTESVDDHAKLFLPNGRYVQALRTDGRSAARAVEAAGYATDPQYADKLIALMDSYSLYQYDTVKPAEGGGTNVNAPANGGPGSTGAATAQGIDCSTPLTAATAVSIAAANYRFAARYLVPQQYAWKRLTKAEADAISNAGLKILSVFETTTNRSAGGSSAGRSDGAAAYAEAQAVGQPAGSAIYFAVDYDARAQDYDAIEAYLKAAAAQIPGYEAGVYGSYAVVEEMAKRAACKHFWQTYAWSGGKQSARANVYQYQNNVQVASVAVDLNRSYGGEGWWDLKGGESEMSKEDAEKIIRFLSAAWYAAPDQASKDEFNRLANEIRKAAGIPTL
ncbi:glucosaminidase domain-containing protein [Cohnella zeiphila]|uniref:DUF1906 domain-containing protein n=1 Tax=Cohnella zeiphila TaxID=2761120 RepID=A0A7X0VTL5_9BACL|nr:DUF1906 domain-containing protein [Cohnella zeiphila]